MNSAALTTSILPGRPVARPAVSPDQAPTSLRLFASRAARCTAGLILGAALALSGAALAPTLVGWSPLVVTSGSMRPTIDPGDILVIRPGERGAIVGSIVVVPDPARPGHTFAHRVVQIAPDQTLVTKGDANPSEDVFRTSPGDVVGVTRLVVPYAGRPALLWLRRSPWDALYWLPLVAAVAFLVRARRL